MISPAFFDLFVTAPMDFAFPVKSVWAVICFCILKGSKPFYVWFLCCFLSSYQAFSFDNGNWIPTFFRFFEFSFFLENAKPYAKRLQVNFKSPLDS